MIRQPAHASLPGRNGFDELAPRKRCRQITEIVKGIAGTAHTISEHKTPSVGMGSQDTKRYLLLTASCLFFRGDGSGGDLLG